MRLNLPIAFASLLLSIMLWLVVYAQNVTAPDTIAASATLDGLDASRFFVRKPPNEVRLDVKGPADRIKEMRAETITAYIDLSRPESGLHDYPVSISPAWVARFLVKPRPTARVQIERVSEREIAVTGFVKGSLRDPTLQITGRRFSPLSVMVRGPESEVSGIEEVRAYFDLSKIDPLHPDTQESELVPLDRRGGRPEHVRTSPAVVVNYFKLVVTPATKPAQVVPDLDVTYDPAVLPDGWSVDPKSVVLRGKPSVLANVSKIPTQIVRARGLGRTRTYTVRLLPPAGTTVVGSSEVGVTVLVRPGPTPRQESEPSAAGPRP